MLADGRPFLAAPPPAAFVAPSVPRAMVALAPAAGMATGHPVTLGSDFAAARSGVPTASRTKAGLVIAGIALVTLLGGVGAWALLGKKPSVPAEQPVELPSASVVEPPPPAPPLPEPSASAAVTAASAAPSTPTKATPKVPVVVPLKPKPKSEQELLNRRH
jgi:hypothetical protein